MAKLLITGFEPFGGESINPAQEAVRKFEGRKIADIDIEVRYLPVVHGGCWTKLEGYIKEVKPDIVISVGQASGRLDISLERVAINVDDFRIPDNSNKQFIDEPIVKGGPVAYWSTLPIRNALNSLRASGVPASISNTAGTYVCNHLFYRLMDYIAQDNQNIRGGFIHIPFLPEQAAKFPGQQPSMGMETILKGLELIIKACAA
ncbi:MAG: pyroglutamyl-peptidase I [Elusimicrobiota bacterium]|jgi:pyroglutamyl-peptidase|nr:pyroglutamyl-peptidase I [Elusimicrobiota bacterium]